MICEVLTIEHEIYKLLSLFLNNPFQGFTQAIFKI